MAVGRSPSQRLCSDLKFKSATRRSAVQPSRRLASIYNSNYRVVRWASGSLPALDPQDVDSKGCGAIVDWSKGTHISHSRLVSISRDRILYHLPLCLLAERIRMIMPTVAAPRGDQILLIVLDSATMPQQQLNDLVVPFFQRNPTCRSALIILSVYSHPTFE